MLGAYIYILFISNTKVKYNLNIRSLDELQIFNSCKKKILLTMKQF